MVFMWPVNVIQYNDEWLIETYFILPITMGMSKKHAPFTCVLLDMYDVCVKFCLWFQ